MRHNLIRFALIPSKLGSFLRHATHRLRITNVGQKQGWPTRHQWPVIPLIIPFSIKRRHNNVKMMRSSELVRSKFCGLTAPENCIYGSVLPRRHAAGIRILTWLNYVQRRHLVPLYAVVLATIHPES